MTDDVFSAKVRQVIEDSIRGLDPDDLAERIEWSRQHGTPGVVVEPEGESFRFVYGGKLLAVVDAAALTDDDAVLPAPEFVAEAPDVVPDEWSEG